MHALEVIIAKNAEAAGRAEAHAANDGDVERATKILRTAIFSCESPEQIEAYGRGYLRGRQEG